MIEKNVRRIFSILPKKEIPTKIYAVTLKTLHFFLKETPKYFWQNGYIVNNNVRVNVIFQSYTFCSYLNCFGYIALIQFISILLSRVGSVVEQSPLNENLGLLASPWSLSEEPQHSLGKCSNFNRFGMKNVSASGCRLLLHPK